MRKATQQQTKKHNQRLILKSIYMKKGVSRANLSRATHLTRTTVSSLVGELIEEGLVTEVGTGPSRGGKPPILLNVDENARQVIGIDLGNSEFRGGLFNLRGQQAKSIKLPVKQRQGEAAIELIYQLIKILMAESTQPLLGIGIGTPGITDAESGVVFESVNLGWHDLPLKNLLQTQFDLPTYVANDSKVAALGEFTFGAKRDSQNLVVVKVGQGISAGIILNGQLFLGDEFGSGEIGHVTVVENGNLCSCGQRGCLETVASSRAIINQAKVVMQQNGNKAGQRWLNNAGIISTNKMLTAFKNGDEQIQEIINHVGCYLGIVISYLVSILNIHHVVIAGRIARFGEALLQPIRQEVHTRVLPQIAKQTVIKRSKLKQKIVVQGAAAMLLSEELGLV